MSYDEMRRALYDTFGEPMPNGPRTNYIVFTALDAPVAMGNAIQGKTLASATLLVEKLLLMNAQKDQGGNATAGNFVVIGNDTDQLFELPPGAAVELEWVDLAHIGVGYIGTALTGAQVVAVRWVAHGRVKR